jgi:hypothetical protein
MVADDTAGYRTKQAMMSRVPGNAADHSTLDAAFGVGRRGRHHCRQR